MAAFIRYPKEATTCLSRSLRSLACTGSRAFGIAAFYRLWVKSDPTRIDTRVVGLLKEVHMADNNINKQELDLIAILLAIFLPPLGVLLEEGVGVQFVLNIILTLFGWLPGVIHAFYVILKDSNK
jgi:uncharacterized membrane protein YqaE (UPF0057 family)